jgi:hypothetical protein
LALYIGHATLLTMLPRCSRVSYKTLFASEASNCAEFIFIRKPLPAIREQNDQCCVSYIINNVETPYVIQLYEP